MSIENQIWIGLLPAAFLLVGYIVREKKNVIPVLCALAVLAGAGSASSWIAGQFSSRQTAGQEWGIAAKEEEEDAESGAEETVHSADAGNSYALIDGLIAKGACEEAEELLKSTIKTWGYQPRAALTKARLSVKRGDFSAAEALYRKAEEAGILDENGEEEYAAVRRAAAAERTDVMLLHAFPEYRTGEQPDGREKEEAAQLAEESLEQSLEEYGDDYGEAAEAVADINRIYTSYLNADVSELDRFTQAEGELREAIEEHPELQDMDVVNHALIKTSVLNGNYKDITKGLDRDSDLSEIMIASQLYAEGYVDNDDFTESYVENDREKIDAVREQLQRIEKNSSGELKERAKELDDWYQGFRDGGAIYQLQQDLLEAAVQRKEDSSKIYLQMAKLELIKENEEEAAEYIAQAFQTADVSDDSDYAASMHQIISLMGKRKMRKG